MPVPHWHMQDYPFLRPFYTDAEIEFAAAPYTAFASRYFNFAFVMIVAYLVRLRGARTHEVLKYTGLTFSGPLL